MNSVFLSVEVGVYIKVGVYTHRLYNFQRFYIDIDFIILFFQWFYVYVKTLMHFFTKK